MTKKATDIVAYLTLIGWIVAYFAGTKDESRFHLNQGLVLAVAELILSILNRIFSGFFISLVLWLVGLGLFVLWLIAFIGACQGQEKPMPLLGGIQLLK